MDYETNGTFVDSDTWHTDASTRIQNLEGEKIILDTMLDTLSPTKSHSSIWWFWYLQFFTTGHTVSCERNANVRDLWYFPRVCLDRLTSPGSYRAAPGPGPGRAYTEPPILWGCEWVRPANQRPGEQHPTNQRPGVSEVRQLKLQDRTQAILAASE